MYLLDKLIKLFSRQAYAADDSFGTIKAPAGVAEYNALAGSGPNAIGIVIFASRALRVFTIVAGIYAFYNIVTAGLALVSGGGKSDKYSEATNKITMSVIGLIIIVASYTIAGLIGQLVFGDPGYILNPKICGPEGC